MNTELGGNGMRAPVFDKMIAKDLRFKFRADSQGFSPVIKGRSSRPCERLGALHGPQKVDPEERRTFAVTKMAINARLGVIARSLWPVLYGIQCKQQ